MRRVLVTGATGFAGSHVLECLHRDASVEAIAACRNPERLPPGFSGAVRAGDLLDSDYLAGLFDGIDTVCHCAAWSSLFGHAALSAALHLEPSLRVIDAARSAGVTRFVNTSTTSAAAPQHSSDAMSCGIARRYWPHLVNVVAVEDRLRTLAGDTFTVINLRLGLFAGRHYSLGLLPILLPRLRTHLVPWVAGGRTGMPIIDGRDIGRAFLRAVQVRDLQGYRSFNIAGPEIPTVRDVIGFLNSEYGLPQPHFSVPFPLAFAFAGLMELLDPLLPGDPLVTRSIIHLLRDTGASNQTAYRVLGYRPEIDWRDAIRVQIEEMNRRQTKPMRMTMPVH